MMNQDDPISVLETLIETCRDGEKGYKDAAEHVKRPDLKAFFAEQSVERGRFPRELEAELARLGMTGWGSSLISYIVPFLVAVHSEPRPSQRIAPVTPTSVATASAPRPVLLPCVRAGAVSLRAAALVAPLVNPAAVRAFSVLPDPA